jgi:hypothetical protein
MEDEANIFTNRELEELGKFGHIHEQIDGVAEHADQNVGWFCKMAEDGKPKKEDLVFMMDARLIRTMHYIALHMYEQFSQSPHMKEAADFIVGSRHIEQQNAEQFEKNELNAMWNQS